MSPALYLSLSWGLAVQPSELVLLEVLHTQGVRPQDLVGLTLAVAAGIAVSALTAGWLCGHVVAKLMTWFQRWFGTIVLVLIMALIINVAWLGWSSDQMMYYLATFAVCAVIGLLLSRQVDALPLVLVLLLQNQLDIVLPRIYQFYLS
jgi:hypothetical protein